MKIIKRALFCIHLLAFIPVAQAQDSLWKWEYGAYNPGFRLMEEVDFSRIYPSGEGNGLRARPVRIYIWYPTQKTNRAPMQLKEYIHLASTDFKHGKVEETADLAAKSIPVQLSKGLKGEELKELLERPTAAVRNAAFAKGHFPLLVIGQGLYYESPLSHVVLCEFLASHGYIVATCPLLGTQYRLVNLNVEDLETGIRDLEFVIGIVRGLPQVKIESLGVIGYDLGGMTGLTLSMRNRDVCAFLSLDAGIISGHSSGLPDNHPQYHEERFTIPWMHITQARFIKNIRDERGIPLLTDRKTAGDSYLVHVPTDNHGEFTSYAMFGMRDALVGYWGPWGSAPEQRYRTICRHVLDFFDAYVKRDQGVLSKLRKSGEKHDPRKGSLTVEYKQGQAVPPSMAELINLIIEKGIEKAVPVIEEARKVFPDSVLIEENILNWLGYHFMYWWGREEEAVDVFRLNVSLFPESSNAYTSLGEAYLSLGDTEPAIRSYKRSLQINPENAYAAERLRRLEENKK